jgi:periplasmic protein TonB
VSVPTTRQSKPAATGPKQQATDDSSDGAKAGQGLTQSQTKMMNDQLTTPRVISAEMKKQVAENEPPPAMLGVAGAEGLGGSGAIGSAFNGHAAPVVKAAKPIAISSGVATGMLIHKTEPIYPPIAKAARVSGTVQLSATITKNGTIKDVQVLGGPVMLRQSAVDAVRTWRYKPYRLNDEPADVETTVNVVFTLGQ